MAFLGFVLLAAVALVLAITASQVALRDSMNTVRAEQENRHRVAATVVTQVAGQRPEQELAMVRWGEPGRENFGLTDVGRPVRPEEPVVVWLDRDNRLTVAPASPATATQTAGMVGASVLIGCTLFGAVSYGCARWWVNRQRLAAWAAEWERVGPQWRRPTA